MSVDVGEGLSGEHEGPHQLGLLVCDTQPGPQAQPPPFTHWETEAHREGTSCLSISVFNRIYEVPSR